jgi:hypothetical protein
MAGVGAKQGSRSQSIAEKCAIHNDTFPAGRQCERLSKARLRDYHSSEPKLELSVAFRYSASFLCCSKTPHQSWDVLA